MRRKMIQILFLLALCGLVLSGCSDSDSESSDQKITGSGTVVYLVPGQVKKLSVKGGDGDEKWTSANKQVARVDNGNEITAVHAGKTTIETTKGKKKYQCPVVVMELSRSSLSMKDGTSRKLKVKNGGGKVKWTSSDKTVCKVRAGKIKAVGEGEATVTAKAHGCTLRCTVRVPQVIFSAKKLTTGKFESLSESSSIGSVATIHTNYFSGTPVFTSSDPSVATVSPEGEIKGIKGGKARIKVSADGLTYSATILVEDRPVDIFLQLLSEYSKFVKKHSKYVARDAKPTSSFKEAKALVAKGKKAKVNCRAGITWAFTDMGITTGADDSSYAIYAKKGTFKDKYTGSKSKDSNIQNYLTRITDGKVTGKTVKEAVDEKLLEPGDMCCFRGRTHTFTYSGKGYKFYDGGKICEMTGYGKIGLLLDFSTGKARKYSFNSRDRVISEVLRWK